MSYLDDLTTAVFSEETQEEANTYFQQVLNRFGRVQALDPKIEYQVPKMVE
jgi:hypothetical protein